MDDLGTGCRLCDLRDVFWLEPGASLDAETQQYGFFVTGPLSPISTFILSRATSLGGEFQVSITASQSGSAWGDERPFKFILDEGRLLKP